MPELLTYHQEVYRKLIHISSCTIAILLWYFSKDIFLPWIISAAIIFSILDYAKKIIPFINNFYFTLFGKITRYNEYKTLSGASWVLMGAVATIYLFNEKSAIIGLIVMSLADSAAALIGIKYGATRFFKKSLEGTIAFFITTYLVIFILASASIMLTFITSIIVTTIELFSTPKLNDNILIPIVTALILTLGGIH